MAEPCFICLEDITSNTLENETLDCGHTLHAKCFIACLRTNNRACGLCRQDTNILPHSIPKQGRPRRRDPNVSNCTTLAGIPATGLVVLMFYSDQCYFSNNIDPIFTELAAMNVRYATFMRADIHNPNVKSDLMSRFDIQGTPTFVFLQNAQIINKFSGCDIPKLQNTILDNI